VVDWVFFRLQPYKNMSLKQENKDNKKIPKYYIYPYYNVFSSIDNIVYKLELLPSSHAHQVFHVLCLNKVIGDNILV
jgi:hypothetical protein